MKIREYRSADLAETIRLFHDTVHTVNAKDYTSEQLDAWAPESVDRERWSAGFLSSRTLVAVENDRIVGFGNMTSDGYLDKLYVHRDFQHRGIATALCNELEAACNADKITVHASITARPFFQARGYETIRRQQVERGKVRLTNYVMQKTVHSRK